MALSDVASMVLEQIVSSVASPVADLGDAIENSRAAEPGPPTGVKPFTGADASTGALMAKLGARVFQRARERRAADEKAKAAQSVQAQREAQMRRLDELSAFERQRLANEQERLGLERRRVKLAEDKPADPNEWITADPDTGKPLPAAMKYADWSRIKASNARASAADRLRRDLAKGGGSSSTTLDSVRALDAVPGFSETKDRVYAQALQRADAERAAAGKKPYDPRNERDMALRKLVAEQYYPAMLDSAMARTDSLRAGPIRNIRAAARADSSAAVHPAIQALIESLNTPD